MATANALARTPFDPRERALMRVGLRLLLAWQVVWATFVFPASTQLPPEWRALLTIAQRLSPVLIVAGAGLCVAGLALQRRRLGRWAPPAALAALAANLLWYAVVARWPGWLLIAQASHAVQYLPFPLRVMHNVDHNVEQRAPPWRRFAKHALVLAVIGTFLFEALPRLLNEGLWVTLGESPVTFHAYQGLVVFLNIHHYFADSVIWHIRNPHVRDALFAHVPR